MSTQDFGQYNAAVRQNGLRLNANEPLVAAGTVTLPAGTTIGGSSVVALGTVTSSSANALAVGPNGTTNPSFNVDASTASAATGLNVKSAAAAGGLAVSVTSSGTDENLKLDAKGAGTVTINGTATGNITLGSTSNVVNFAQTEIASGTTAIVTLGNYGGTGRPTAAAQDGWLKVKVAGVDKWIPLWA